MKVLILAAGEGRRFPQKIPKPATKVCGVPLILRNIFFLKKLGLEPIVVGGHKFDWLKENLPEDIELIRNPSIEKGNAFSVLCAEKYLKGRFFVLMGDHLYLEDFLGKMLDAPLNSAIVCKKNEFIDIDESTKISARDGKIVDIGKGIEEWNYIDTGAFLCEDSIFKILEELFEVKDSVEWSEVVKRSDMGIYETEEPWIDLDTEEDLKHVENLLVNSLKKAEDGFISRHINRRFSGMITRRLANFDIGPNSISIFCFMLCALSAFFFYEKILWLGGILALISSILDGCDGELARLKLKESKFGGFFDSILDRYGDAMIIFGIFSSLGSSVLDISIGFAALFGVLMISGTSWRFECAFEEKIHKYEGLLKYIPGKRDERMLIIFLGGIFGIPFYTLLLLAILTNLRILGRIFIADRNI